MGDQVNSASSGNAPQQANDQAAAKERYRAAKAAYKQARKDAGKSRVPFVVACIVVLLIVAGLSAGATWYFMGQQGTGTPVVSSSDDATQDGGLDSYAKYVGTWKGSLTSTEAVGAASRCYGAEGEGMTLTIESISDSGRIKATADVVYHGHVANSESRDMDTISGDTAVSLNDLTGTFQSYGFDFSDDVNGSGDRVDMRVRPITSSGKDQLEVTVTSVFDGRTVETDTYLLTK